MDALLLDVPRFAQPDDVTCGPTCMMKLYHYYGDLVPFEEVVGATRRNRDGGTLAVYLGLEALSRGYRVRIHSYNLRIFDPTWRSLPLGAIAEKLRARAATLEERKLVSATLAHAELLDKGGKLGWSDLSRKLLMGILDRGRPILTGLSATYLYQRTRERPDDNKDDDVGGEPVGHFVVICGYQRGGQSFVLRDPQSNTPFSKTGRYTVPARRLLNAILLGSFTYDSVLLEVWPSRRPG